MKLTFNYFWKIEQIQIYLRKLFVNWRVIPKKYEFVRVKLMTFLKLKNILVYYKFDCKILDIQEFFIISIKIRYILE